MGGRYSKPATASPSAAFGRLRISSPGASSRSVRELARARAASLSDSPRIIATEQSPLLLRKLESQVSEASSPIGSPPVIIWIGPALICALAYALYNIFIKKGSASIHPVLGGVILQFVAAILGSLLLGILVAKEGMEEMQYDNAGVGWAILAGVAVGAAEILSFIVSGMGGMFPQHDTLCLLTFLLLRTQRKSLISCGF